jgi:hypothetical protein
LPILCDTSIIIWGGGCLRHDYSPPLPSKRDFVLRRAINVRLVETD